MAVASREAVLSLYRGILRCHKRVLPHEMRQLGDAYVRDEFRKHSTAKPDFVPAFMMEWSTYLQQLEAGSIGRDMTEEEAAALNEEQGIQLKTLRQEAESQWRDG